jgi:hypothetical protein
MVEFKIDPSTHCPAIRQSSEFHQPENVIHHLSENVIHRYSKIVIHLMPEIVIN